MGVALGIKGTEYTARVALDSHYEAAAHGDYDVDAYLKARDAYTAAVESRVRAECAAKVRGEYLRNTDGSVITVEPGQRLDPDSAYNRAISDAIRALEAK